MNSIQNLFQQAQLAEAAYANFIAHSGDPKAALQDQGNNMNFSDAQATALLKDWRVVNQPPPVGNSFSATLFERLDANQQPTGQYTLAIAGSTSLTDFANDLLDLAAGGVAYFQVQSMLNYVLRLQAGSAGTTRQVELLTGATAPSLTSTLVSGVGPGIAPNQLTIGGHSLGGFLGQVYQRIFGSAGVYTYNALGVVRPNAPVFDQLTSLLGLPHGSYSSGPGENLLVPGEPAQLIGTVQGKPQIQVFSETATINPIDTIPAHKMGPLTDSLAVYALFAQLDPSFNSGSLSTITSLLKASSSTPANSLEASLAAVGKLFGKAYPTGQTTRDDFYTHLYDLQTALSPTSAGLLTVVSLASLNRDQIVALAQTDIAYRYALQGLNPFALTGDDGLYAQHNAHGELNLYDPATGQGNLTDLYLQDRAALLGWVMQFNTQDIAATATPTGDTFYKLGQFGDRYYFEDTATDTRIRLGETVDLLQPPTDFRHIVFGGDVQHTAFDRMAELVDTNQDGIVDATDHLFGQLRVWQDANSDGISLARELKSLDELGITSIDTAQTLVSQPTANGNRIVATSSYTRNGQQQYSGAGNDTMSGDLFGRSRREAANDAEGRMAA